MVQYTIFKTVLLYLLKVYTGDPKMRKGLLFA